MKQSLFLLLLVFVTACSEDVTPKKRSGYFKLAQVNSAQDRSAAARIQETVETAFDLGTIKASREFYFLLANGGETDITGVTLSTDNPAFIISPASINVLPAGSESLVPLISLGIEHGPRLNGIGHANLLPMGENNATLTITGSTIENGETVLLESTFTLTVDVKTMDITVYSDNVEVDYNNFTGQYSGSEFESGLPAIPSYTINPGNVKVKNTGNVDILFVINHWSANSQVSEMTLSPNQTVTISFPAPVTADYYLSLITIDGQGTVTNRNRVKQGIDGKGYLLLEKSTLE